MRKRARFLTQIVLLASAFLLTVNVLLGSLLTNQSDSALRAQIHARMLDVANSAAALLDGDSLARLCAEDAGTEPYQDALNTLRAFQDHVELAYIYCIRDMGDGTFTFTIDPTVRDPAAFGEYVATTDALLSASRGVSAVDSAPYTDRWGQFYSAYSPVFDSAGHIAGIVAVDFDAGWYETQIAQQNRTVLIVSAASLLIGALIAFVITGRLQKRLVELNSEIGNLTEDMGELSRELRLASGRRQADNTRGHGKPRSLASDRSIEELSGMVHEVREEMREYIADAHALAYTDALTGAGNRTAYFGEVDRANRSIADGTADFSVAVFDINGLKKVNDEKGHESGDRLIAGAAAVLRSTFPAKSIYRIGGDEFAAVLEHVAGEYFDRRFAALERALAAFNQESELPLSLSKGVAVCGAEDRSFNEVFRRADEAMYADKARYYAEHGDRRGRAPRDN